MMHGHCLVVLFVNSICDKRERMFRNYFFNKYYASPPFTVVVVSHIEAKIYFFKVYMEWDPDPKQLCVLKHKPDKADVTRVVPKINFSSGREELAEQVFIYS